MTLFGDGEQKRAFSYISDVAPVLARSIEVPKAYNEVFNVGADTPYTVNQLAETVAEAMGVEPRIKHLPARNEVKYAYSSHDKVRNCLGTPEIASLEEGVGRMAAWVKQHGARQSQKFENIEVTKNFPAAWLD
jgi:UDP-glucose 4-epimerase